MGFVDDTSETSFGLTKVFFGFLGFMVFTS